MPRSTSKSRSRSPVRLAQEAGVNSSDAGAVFDKEEETVVDEEGGVAVFDMEGGGSSPRAKPRRKAPGGGGGAKALFARVTDGPSLHKLAMVFLGLQGLVFCIWAAMWQGLLTGEPLPAMQPVVGLYALALITQGAKLHKYKKRTRKLTFSKETEFDFYNQALAQMKFHGMMVLQPLALMVAIALAFTFSFIEGCSYYNVRAPPVEVRANLSAYTTAMRGSIVGCSDDRALNYNPETVEHDADRCDFVRCHQDVYKFGEGWPTWGLIAATLYLWLFAMLVITALLLSFAHLKYFEGLYMQRHNAMPFLKDMWRNVVNSYSATSASVETYFGSAQLRLFHGALIATQGILVCVMAVGKQAVNHGWFVEFDISVLILGYECGRHAPQMHYIRSENGNCDIYLMSQRLKWHRESLYHFFVLCAAQAYLVVSGGFRMRPGDDWSNSASQRKLVNDVFGPTGADSDHVQWMMCVSGVSSDTREMATWMMAALFFLLVGFSGWLSIAHYLQYQDLKRQHSTLISFAKSFKHMLARRREKVGRAYAQQQSFDENQGELCPKGGFYVQHWSDAAPRRTRGRLIVARTGLLFSKDGGIPELHDIHYATSSVTQTKQISGTPPEVLLTLEGGHTVTFSSPMARALLKSVDKVLPQRR